MQIERPQGRVRKRLMDVGEFSSNDKVKFNNLYIRDKRNF